MLHDPKNTSTKQIKNISRNSKVNLLNLLQVLLTSIAIDFETENNSYTCKIHLEKVC